jgi:hypothetical protein
MSQEHLVQDLVKAGNLQPNEYDIERIVPQNDDVSLIEFVSGLHNVEVDTIDLYVMTILSMKERYNNHLPSVLQFVTEVFEYFSRTEE